MEPNLYPTIFAKFQSIEVTFPIFVIKVCFFFEKKMSRKNFEMKIEFIYLSE